MYTHKYRCMNRIKQLNPCHGRIYILLHGVHYDTVEGRLRLSTQVQVSAQSFIMNVNYYEDRRTYIVGADSKLSQKQYRSMMKCGKYLNNRDYRMHEVFIMPSTRGVEISFCQSKVLRFSVNRPR